MGEVPGHLAIAELIRSELVVSVPAGRVPATVTLLEDATYADLRNEVEKAFRWVYHDREMHEISWAQSVDELRLFRRRRVLVPLSIRFVRVAAGTSLEEISAGYTLYQYTGLFPDGQDTQFSSQQERGFTEGVVGVDSGSVDTVVKTTRKTISSGLNIDGFVTLMPGGWARFVGNLSVSAFTGTGLDRSVTTVPLSVDIPRYRWQAVHVFSAVDLAGSWQFGSSPTVRLGGDWVRVDVRVD